MKRTNSLLRSWPGLLLALAAGLSQAGEPAAVSQPTAAPAPFAVSAGTAAAPDVIRIAWDRVGSAA